MCGWYDTLSEGSDDMWRYGSIVFLAVVLGTAYCAANDRAIANAAVDRFDLLITNARIVDGTGNPWFRGDIGILGDTVTAIGRLQGRPAALTIDAKGMVVSPGFIDLHSHSDRSFDRSDSIANLSILTQGVTTVVTGNDGDGSFEIAKTKAKWEKLGLGTNAILLVPHGTVRDSVTGGEPRAVTQPELDEMKAIVRQAMEEGAWGLSTGLQYRPGRYADTEEIIAIGKVFADYGGVYTSHQRHEGRFMVEATQETIRISKETGLPGNVTHIKAGGKGTAWGLMEKAVKVINAARSEGLSITADMYAYAEAGGGSLSSVFNIPGDMEPLAKLKKAMSDRALPDEEREGLRTRFNNELVNALSDPRKRERIKTLTANGCLECPNYVMMFYWDSLCITRSSKNPHLLGKTLAEAADYKKREQVLNSLFWSVSPPVDPFDAAADLYIEEGEDLHVSGDWMSEDDMKHVMTEPWLMFASDGSGQPLVAKRPVHPRNYGNFPRVLRKYVREEKVITLEDAVRKMSSLPASFLGLKNRGLLLKGYKADVVIFDPERVEDRATFQDPHQYCTGIEHVIIGGEVSVENGKYNGALNGKVLLSTEDK